VATPESGSRFGRLTVASATRRGDRWYVECVCSCGQRRSVRVDHLRSGRTSSCGCLHDESARAVNTKHGHKSRHAVTPEYRAWCNMIDRCHSPRNKSFPNYGGRGVTVCAEWRHDFNAFLAHIGSRPSRGMSIDRIDVNGNYEPGNVRWADAVTQARNVQSIKHIEAFGRQLTLAEWAEAVGIDKRKIHNRISVLGWSPERALTVGATAPCQ
jgi:hypothetical protein